MELPSGDQTALVTVLGAIGAALGFIGRGLYKMLNHFLDDAKAEGVDRGKMLANQENMQKDIDDLKKDVKGIAAFVGTPRSKGEANEQR